MNARAIASEMIRIKKEKYIHNLECIHFFKNPSPQLYIRVHEWS